MAKLCKCGCGQEVREGNTWVHGHHARSPKHNGNWSGGQYTKPDGTVMLLRPDHPNTDTKGYIPEHRWIAEQKMDSRLSTDAEVHHRNGDRNDNRPENLVVCEDHAYHALLHQRKNALENCGHANWFRCRHCGEYEPGDDMYIYNPDGSGDGYKYAYHRKCETKYRRG